MFDASSIPLADLLSSLSSVALVLMVAAALLILWEIALLLGLLVSTIRHRHSQDDVGHSGIR